ncbi:MAG: hypothetical protein V1647_03705, partial [Pseudomonadota bacterium]
MSLAKYRSYLMVLLSAWFFSSTLCSQENLKINLIIPEQTAPAMSTSCREYSYHFEAQSKIFEYYLRELITAHADPDGYFIRTFDQIIGEPLVLNPVDIMVKSAVLSNLIENKKVSQYLFVSRKPRIAEALNKNWAGATLLYEENNTVENLCEMFFLHRIYSEQKDVATGLLQIAGSLGRTYGENFLGTEIIDKVKNIAMHNRVGLFYSPAIGVLGKISGDISSKAMAEILNLGECIDCVDNGESFIDSPAVIFKREQREQNEAYTLFMLAQSGHPELLLQVYNKADLTDAAKNTAARLLGYELPYPNEKVFNGFRDLLIIAQNVMVMFIVPVGEVNAVKPVTEIASAAKGDAVPALIDNAVASSVEGEFPLVAWQKAYSGDVLIAPPVAVVTRPVVAVTSNTAVNTTAGATAITNYTAPVGQVVAQIFNVPNPNPQLPIPYRILQPLTVEYNGEDYIELEDEPGVFVKAEEQDLLDRTKYEYRNGRMLPVIELAGRRIVIGDENAAEKMIMEDVKKGLLGEEEAEKLLKIIADIKAG